MKRYFRFALVAALLILGGWLYFEIKDAAAIVGYRLIPLSRLNKDYSSALRYYSKAAEVYGIEAVKLSNPDFQRELRRAVLDKLVEDAVILKELKAIGGDFEAAVSGKIEFVLKNADVSRNAASLYGLSLEEFEKEVILPQAYREVLEGRLFLKGVSFEDWLKKAKSGETVIIVADGFSWDGRQVTITKQARD